MVLRTCKLVNLITCKLVKNLLAGFFGPPGVAHTFGGPLGEVLLQAVVDAEVHRPVGKQGQERWSQASIETLDTLISKYPRQTACKTASRNQWSTSYCGGLNQVDRLCLRPQKPNVLF